MTIRVLLADDHPLVRVGLRTVLEHVPGIDVVGAAGDGAEVLALSNTLRPDVVLMDLRMPGVDGATATARLRDRHPEIRVLVLTTYDTDADIDRAMEAGAIGYLLKDATRDDLLAAIRTAAAGESVLAPRVATKLMRRMRAPAPVPLSAREIEILRLVGEGRTNKQVAAALHLSLSTVKTHLLHVFAKLGVDDRTEAVTAATRAGYLQLD
jgi:DNA-binding NarL/FixJ family response regulator